MAKKPSGGTPATAALGRAGVHFTLHPYQHHADSTSYGTEAAAALGADPRRVFRTLVAAAGSGSEGAELIVAVVPVATHLDLKALAAALGAKKATMADPAVAVRSSGYVLGGISPLGQRTPLRTVVDTSALAHDTVLVSAGRRGLQLELAPSDLVTVTSAVVAVIGV